jgi:hypothetical protein
MAGALHADSSRLAVVEETRRPECRTGLELTGDCTVQDLVLESNSNSRLTLSSKSNLLLYVLVGFIRVLDCKKGYHTIPTPSLCRVIRCCLVTVQFSGVPCRAVLHRTGVVFYSSLIKSHAPAFSLASKMCGDQCETCWGIRGSMPACASWVRIRAELHVPTACTCR